MASTKAPPAAFQALLAKEAQALEENQQRANTERKVHEAEEMEEYHRLVRSLEPYNSCKIGKLSIRVSPDECEKTVRLWINDEHWMDIKIVRNWSHCSCENVCDCPSRTWVTTSSIQHKQDSEYGTWFPSGKELDNPDTIAAHVQRILKDYQFEITMGRKPKQSAHTIKGLQTKRAR
jgi:hypothetical protein